MVLQSVFFLTLAVTAFCHPYNYYTVQKNENYNIASTSFAENPIVVPGYFDVSKLLVDESYDSAPVFKKQEDCDDSKIIQATFEEPRLPIPEAPVLPPSKIQEIPAIVPAEYYYVQPEEPAKSQQEEIQTFVQTLPIPSPPELPPFVLPEIPSVVQYVEEPAAPAAPVQASPEVPCDKPAGPIPAPPQLPPYVASETPARIEIIEQPITTYIPQAPPKPTWTEEKYEKVPIPAAPELPTFALPQIPVKLVLENEPIPNAPAADVPCDEKQPITPLAPIPAPPQLPAFVAPEIPAVVKYEEPIAIPEAPAAPIEEPCAKEEPTPALPIPAPPQLPPFEYPQQPIEIPVIPEIPEPAVVQPLAPIPAAPELPRFEIPELPKIEIIEPAPIPKPCDEEIQKAPAAPIPTPPQLPAFVAPEIPTIEIIAPEPAPIAKTPASDEPCEPKNEAPEPQVILAPIPAAPVLPPLELPKIPTLIEIPQAPIADEIPCKEEKYPIPAAPELPAYTEVKYEAPEPQVILAPIPAAPVLPPLELPKIPTLIEIPQAPIADEIPCKEEKSPIPAAPELPAYTEVRYEAPIAPAPEPIYEAPTPPAPIPAPPQLPPFQAPEIPAQVSYEPIAPIAPAQKEPCVHEEIINKVPIPAAPQLPPLVLPTPVFTEAPIPEELTIPQLYESIYSEQHKYDGKSNHVKEPIPQAPELPPFKAPAIPELKVSTFEKLPAHDCVRDIVSQRFLSQTLKAIPAAPEIPALRV